MHVLPYVMGSVPMQMRLCPIFTFACSASAPLRWVDIAVAFFSELLCCCVAASCQVSTCCASAAQHHGSHQVGHQTCSPQTSLLDCMKSANYALSFNWVAWSPCPGSWSVQCQKVDPACRHSGTHQPGARARRTVCPTSTSGAGQPRCMTPCCSSPVCMLTHAAACVPRGEAGGASPVPPATLHIRSPGWIAS
jgi:hypothetical protein